MCFFEEGIVCSQSDVSLQTEFFEFYSLNISLFKTTSIHCAIYFTALEWCTSEMKKKNAFVSWFKAGKSQKFHGHGVHKRQAVCATVCI